MMESTFLQMVFEAPRDLAASYLYYLPVLSASVC